MSRRPRRTIQWRVVALLIVAAVAGLGLLIERGRHDASAAAERVPPLDGSARARPAAGFDQLFRQGVAHLRRGNAHRAAVAFEAARQRRPQVPETYVNLGFAYLELGVPRAAQTAFEQALALRPAQVNAFYGLAESHERLGEMEAALGAMRSYAHLTGDDDPHRRKALAAIWEWSSRPGREDDPSVASHPPIGDTIDVAGLPGTKAGVEGSRNPSHLRLIRLEPGEDFLQEYRGRTLVLNIWATWCAPCRAELPSLQSLSERLDERHFAVAGLSIDEDADFAREFLREVGVDYANYIDPSRGFAEDVLGVYTVPQTFIIGPDGEIRERHVGFRIWDSADVAERLEPPR